MHSLPPPRPLQIKGRLVPYQSQLRRDPAAAVTWFYTLAYCQTKCSVVLHVLANTPVSWLLGSSAPSSSGHIAHWRTVFVDACPASSPAATPPPLPQPNPSPTRLLLPAQDACTQLNTAASTCATVGDFLRRLAGRNVAHTGPAASPLVDPSGPGPFDDVLREVHSLLDVAAGVTGVVPPKHVTRATVTLSPTLFTDREGSSSPQARPYPSLPTPSGE
jgi:hypothetical protein